MPSRDRDNDQKRSQPNLHQFVHPPLEEEVRAIGGGYTYLREVLMPVGDRQLLYLLGAAVVDTSCCGVGGCGFALVPGFLGEQAGLERTEDNGRVSLVEPISDERLRREITALIKQTEMVQEVRFWCTKEEVP
ncbi:MAG: hypothetical protein JW797_08580 [Bradymonadales bacterium]|nr:hypothetical protein [Bradymonadales bacterium]